MGFNRSISRGENVIMDGFTGDLGSSFRLQLVGNKKCLGNGIVKNL